jgi:hypothetical protein
MGAQPPAWAVAACRGWGNGGHHACTHDHERLPCASAIMLASSHDCTRPAGRPTDVRAPGSRCGRRPAGTPDHSDCAGWVSSRRCQRREKALVRWCIWGVVGVGSHESRRRYIAQAEENSLASSAKQDTPRRPVLDPPRRVHRLRGAPSTGRIAALPRILRPSVGSSGGRPPGWSRCRHGGKSKLTRSQTRMANGPRMREASCRPSCPRLATARPRRAQSAPCAASHNLQGGRAGHGAGGAAGVAP